MEVESVYVEKVICCQRVIAAFFEMKGDIKEQGPKCGNTSAERRFDPGFRPGGRWMCLDCKTKKIGSIDVFPETCSRPEAKVDA